MPAPLGPCIVCTSSSSKYKCPACQAPTCSLPCHKMHKAEGHAQEAAAGSSSSATASASTSLATQASTSWVPMRSYDSSQFLKDYHFLSQIGRHVSAAGKELVSRGLMPPQPASDSTAGPSQQRRPPPIDPAKHRARKQREALEDAVRTRRCKVLWLPEGMARREENRTVWHDKGKRVRWTVELMWVALEGEKGKKMESGERRRLIHDVPSGMPVEHRVMQELERESLKMAPKDWKRPQDGQQSSASASAEGIAAGPGGGMSSAARKRARKRGGAAKGRGGAEQPLNGEEPHPNEQQDGNGDAHPDSTPAAQPHAHKTQYYISDAILATYGHHSAHSTSSSEASTTPQPYTSLPRSIALAVQVHPTRLRNESSAKYLEWWERRGKAAEQEEEEERQAEAARLVEQERSRQEEECRVKQQQQQQESWGSPPTGPRAMRGAASLPTVATAGLNQSGAAHAPSSLLSANLLAQLSAKLEAANAMQAKYAASKPAAGTEDRAAFQKKGEAQAHAQLNGVSNVSAEGSSPTTRPEMRPPVRLLYPLPTKTGASTSLQANGDAPSPTILSVEGMLRSLPRGHSVVEFPRVEIWSRGELEELSRASRSRDGAEGMARGVKIVTWDDGQEEEGEEVGQPRKEAAPLDKMGDRTLSPQRGASAASLPATPPSAAAAAARPLIPAVSRPQTVGAPKPASNGLAGLLGGYASSDEDDEDDDGDEMQAICSKKPRVEGPQSAALGHSDEEKDKETEEEHDGGGAGLADMARRLGWVTASPPATVSSTNGHALLQGNASGESVSTEERPIEESKRERPKKSAAAAEQDEELDWGDEE